MLKPIKEADAHERMLRALLVIEGITLDPASFSDENSPIGKLLGEIYAVAHAATGLCCTGGARDQFYQVHERLENELLDGNVIDIEKAIQKTPLY